MTGPAGITLRSTIVFLCVGMLITGAWAQESAPAADLPQGLSNQERTKPKPLIAVASIPFEFWIGPEKMPSGLYVLEIIVPSVVVLRSKDSKAQQEVFTLDVGGGVVQKESRLIFVLRNERPMLSEIWCVTGKRRLTSETAPTEDYVRTRVVGLSYP